MPILPPDIDERRYEDIRRELIARIPAHTPEWTSFHEGDPGITMLELFAFVAESVIYRANRIPARNRQKFLSLLGVRMHPGSPARGLVEITAERSIRAPLTLASGTEVRAGKVPFHLDRGLDVLPIEASVFSKVAVQATDQQKAFYKAWYAARLENPDTPLQLYQTTPLGSDGLSMEAAVGKAAWIALLARKREPADDVRRAVAGRVLTVGVAPELSNEGTDLGGDPNDGDALRFEVHTSVVDATGKRSWQLVGSDTKTLQEPGVFDVVLPPHDRIDTFADLEPLDPGTGDLPPRVEDPEVRDRIVLWLRLSASAAFTRRLRWIGVNAAAITQGERVVDEPLPDGTGMPEQEAKLARPPLVPGTLTVRVGGEPWTEADDLATAPREGDPGSRVFFADAEGGLVRFGDGLRGSRPARGARVRASYLSSAGAAGNVGIGMVRTLVGVRDGLKVSNPVETWGGVAAETVADAERRIPRWLQHRDRLVTADDFDAVARRTPGAEIGRIDVIPTFHPGLAPNVPGDAPGAVTLLVLPPLDPSRAVRPDATDRLLGAICAHLEPRRLVTTEVFLRGATWVDVYVSIGIDAEVGPGDSLAEIRERVRRAVFDFLAPVSDAGGWKRDRPVRKGEILAAAARVTGVRSVKELHLGGKTGGGADEIGVSGLELPWLAAIEVVAGTARPLDEVRGTGAGGGGTAGEDGAGAPLPVPVFEDECC
jgi:hypothetical protein